MTITHLITANELEAMGSDARFELIQGVLHPMSPSSYSSNIVLARIGAWLFAFVEQNKLGQVTFAEAGFILEEAPDSVVAPDVAFVRQDRLHVAPREHGFFPGPPDLAIEVVSPSDEPLEIRRKQALYDRAAVPLVWWIDPKRKSVIVHSLHAGVRHLSTADCLDGESIVPGFSIEIARLLDIPTVPST